MRRRSAAESVRMMVVIIHRWEQGLYRKAWCAWGALVAMLRKEDVHRKALQLFERNARHILRWTQTKSFNAWQAHTLRHRTAAVAVKIMFACIRRWHRGLLTAVWAQWAAAVEELPAS